MARLSASCTYETEVHTLRFVNQRMDTSPKGKNALETARTGESFRVTARLGRLQYVLSVIHQNFIAHQSLFAVGYGGRQSATAM